MPSVMATLMLYRILNNNTIRLNTSIAKRRHVIDRRKVENHSRKVIRTESDYIHEVLERIPAYEKHVFPHPRLLADLNGGNHSKIRRIFTNEYSGVSESRSFTLKLDGNVEVDFKTKVNGGPTRIVDVFKRQSLFKTQQEKCLTFFKPIKKFVQEVQFVSDEELLQVMLYACLWTSNPGYNFNLLKNGLDIQCCKRFSTWPIEQQLLVADIWYHLNVVIMPKYFGELIENIPNIMSNLTAPQMVHTLFIINMNRKASLKLMEQFQSKLEETINLLTISEIMVVALAYFKTSSKITSANIIRIMIERLMEEMGSVSTLVFNSFIKTLRHSYRYENRELIVELLNKAGQQKVWKDNIMIGPHLCLLAVNHNAYAPEVVDSVISDLCKSGNVRLKDIKNMLLAITKFNQDIPDDVIEYFKQELVNPEREEEINCFPGAYLSSLQYLAFRNIFLQQQISTVLSYSFYKKLKSKETEEYDQPLAMLDCLVEMDDPTYTGNRLNAQIRSNFLKKYQIRYNTSYDRKTYREDIIKVVGGLLKNIIKNDVALVHVLPYMADPVFLLIFDENGQYCMPPEDYVSRIYQGQFVKAADHQDWLVIWVMTKKELCFDRELTGLSLLKEKHFTKLGFKVVKVPLEVLSNTVKTRAFLQETLKRYIPNS